MQLQGTCLYRRPYTGPVIPHRPLIIAALKTTLKHWNKFMRIVLKGCTGSFAPMSNRLWSGIWIAAISSMVLPGSSAKTVAMNTYWPFPVNADIFAHPVIKRG